MKVEGNKKKFQLWIDARHYYFTYVKHSSPFYGCSLCKAKMKSFIKVTPQNQNKNLPKRLWVWRAVCFDCLGVNPFNWTEDKLRAFLFTLYFPKVEG